MQELNMLEALNLLAVVFLIISACLWSYGSFKHIKILLKIEKGMQEDDRNS